MMTMTLLINVILFVVAIFGFIAYTLYKFFNRSTQGKCGGCDTDCSCDINASSELNELKLNHIKNNN
jgi:hypothetical protein